MLRNIGLALVTSLACVVIGLFIFGRFLVQTGGARVSDRSISDLARGAGIPEALYRSLGWYLLDSRSADRKYSPMKPANTIRIGAFGDSNTFGDEVDPGLDYPSQLERLFRDAGVRNVEVLNFGNNAFGCHQAYRLWESHARSFALDMILIGPFCEHPERDETFSELGIDSPEQIHGRYVLTAGGDIRFVDGPTGSTLIQRYDALFGLLSGFRFLGYDRNRPVITQELRRLGLSWLKNPFYYSSLESREEQARIYRRMTRNLLDIYGQVVTLHPDEGIVSSILKAGSHSVAERYGGSNGYPFRRKGHPSAAGYLNAALAYFSVLTGRDEIVQYEIRFAPPQGSAGKELASLDRFSQHEVRLAGYRAGHFVRLEPIQKTRERDPLVDFSREGISGLAGISGTGRFVSDSFFYPLRGDALARPPEIELVNGPVSIRLGTLRKVSPGLGVYHFEIDGLRRRFDQTVFREYLYWEKKSFEAVIAGHASELKLEKDAKWALKVGTAEILDLVGVSPDEFKLVERTHAPISLRMGASDSLDLEKMPVTGQLSLALGPETDGSYRAFVLSDYVKGTLLFPYDKKRVKTRIGWTSPPFASLVE